MAAMAMDKLKELNFGFSLDPNAPEFVFSTVLVTVILLSGLFIFLSTRRKGNVTLPPVASGGLPLLGQLVPFTKDPLKLATECWKKYGGMFTCKILGLRLTFLIGPDAHIAFFKPTDEQLSQSEAYRYSVPMFGPDVVYDAPPEKMAEQLRLVHRLLKTDSLKSYPPKMIQEAEDFFDKWGNEGEVDLSLALSQLVTLTASSCLMGPEIRENLFVEVEQLLHTVDDGVTPISFFAPYLPIPAHRKRDRARDQIHAIFAKVIRERKAKGVKNDDILQAFMDHVYKDGRPIKEHEVAGLMIALLFAGQHTSSITSTWTGLLLLHSRKKFLQPVKDELNEILKTTNGQITAESLNDMKLLHSCVKEALRMFPPIIFIVRKVMSDVTHNGITIPKGDYVFASPALAGRDPTVFAKPDEFDPYRFLPPREEDKKVDYGFLGFGAGRHPCLGERFAYSQIKTIWAVLLRDFELELVGDLPKPCYGAMLVGPTRPSLVRFKRLRPRAS